MKVIFFVLGLGISSQLFAQEVQESALQKVFNTLMLQQAQIMGDTLPLLNRGAWEALTYLEYSDSNSIEDLQEAVPDYYRFFDKEVLIKLINPNNINAYGLEMRVAYKLNHLGEICLIKEGTVKQKWKLLYLDENYMALEMDQLRIFFTHTPTQE